MNNFLKTPIRNFLLFNVPKHQERFRISNGVKILITSLAVLGTMFLALPSVFAQPPDLVNVQFEQSPLFDETGFMPGDNISHWIKITNNTSDTQKIVTKAMNVTNPDHLGAQFDFVIKQGVTTLYTGTLESFFEAGIINLSDLASGSGSQNQYDFIATLKPETGNDFQNKTLGFDFVIGVDKIEMHDGGTLGVITGGGGGGIILSIFNEDNKGTIPTNSYKVSWYTNVPATTRVLYDTISHSTLGSAPNFGYPYSSIEDPTLTSYHEVILTGLTPGLTYYWKPVSGNPTTLGKESFFTLAVVAGESTEQQNGGTGGEQGGGIGWPTGASDILQGIFGGNEGGSGTEGTEEGQGGEIAGVSTENRGGLNPAYFLASIGPFLKNLLGIDCAQINDCCWKLSLILTILGGIYLFFREGDKSKKRKLGNYKKFYIDLAIALAAIIVLIIWLKCWWLFVPMALFAGFLIKEKYNK